MRGKPSNLFIPIDTTLYDEAGRAIGTIGDLLPDATSVGTAPAGDEPRDPERRFDYFVALMRAPYPPKRWRSRRPLLVSDLIRTGQLAGEIRTCRRDGCGKTFASKGTGRPRLYCSSTCRSLARKSAA